jgi:2-polyprenyl-6-methoxyphenol hydroxylase-like FAD-dependent oxidoreductase
MSRPEPVDVLVVGAGQAGLAAGHAPGQTPYGAYPGHWVARTARSVST